jgi:hypothetical protein
MYFSAHNGKPTSEFSQACHIFLPHSTKILPYRKLHIYIYIHVEHFKALSSAREVPCTHQVFITKFRKLKRAVHTKFREIRSSNSKVSMGCAAYVIMRTQDKHKP